jgi:fructokinase
MKVLGFGAILWDEINGVKKIGGAVFNLLAHTVKLGASASLISAVGKESLGTRAIRSAESHGVNTDLIKKVDKETCVVKVTLDDKGIPDYIIEDPTSWDYIEVSESEIEKIKKESFDYFVFGTLEQRNDINYKSIKKIFSQIDFKIKFYDMNLRSDFYTREIIEYLLSECNILKVSMEEVDQIKRLFYIKDTGLEDTSKNITQNFNIEVICITAGEKGAYVYSDNEFIHCPGYAVEVIDTVGSGDAFGAGFLYGLWRGDSLSRSCDFACRLGTYTAGFSGAVPDYNPGDLENMKFKRN